MTLIISISSLGLGTQYDQEMILYFEEKHEETIPIKKVYIKALGKEVTCTQSCAWTWKYMQRNKT